MTLPEGHPWLGLAVLLVLPAAGGCALSRPAFPQNLYSPRVQDRVQGARMAADYSYPSAGDRRAVMLMLVDRLRDDDSAVRFAAIMALEQMTGSRRGYLYYAPFERREPAVLRWQRYVEAMGSDAATSRPEVPSGGPG